VGFMDTIKGWLNIGGVKVKLSNVETKFPRNDNTMTGDVVLTSKSDKTVLDIEVEMVLEKSTGRGEERKTEKKVLGSFSFARNMIGSGFPMDIKTGETKTFTFVLPVSIPRELSQEKGVLGAIGKIGAFASNDKFEYYVKAEADVKGTPFDPTDKVTITVVD
jgi:hypothetical protein